MLRPGSTPGPQASGLSFEGRAVPDYGAPFNFFVVMGVSGVAVSSSPLCFCVSHTSPAAICCTMLFVLWVALQIAFPAMDVAFRHPRNILRGGCGASNSPRGFDRCTLAYFSLLWRPLRARKTIFMGLPNRRDSPIPSWKLLKFTPPRKKQGRNWPRSRLTHQDSRNFSVGDTTWLTFQNVRFQRTRSLPRP
jgi:hypothetical protein